MYPMNALIESKRDDLIRLCHKHHVRRLELFGSATTDEFNPQTSDLDFLVAFDTKSPKQHADAYFGLLFDLEDLFSKQIDLVEEHVIRNPYFLRGVNQTRKLLYAA